MRILVADDLYTNRLQAGITIRAMGHTFDEAAHGDEAIEKMMENEYDLILMDIEMPVRNGLETTRYIRQQFEGKKRDIPIVAITAHNPEEFFDDYAKEGFTGLIAKPITKQKLENSIAMINRNK